VTAAGSANQVLRVPPAGGTPVFSSLGALADLSVVDLTSAEVSGLLPIAHGGTGTNTPTLTAGVGISITGTWPAQTITNSSNYAALADPLPVAHGGSGTATPSVTAGTGISISGSWPSHTITNTSAYATLTDPLPVAHGGTGTTTPALVAGTYISITGTWPAQTINDTCKYAPLADPLPVAHGGTGTTTPALVAGTGISISGTWPAQTITNTSAYATLGDPLPVGHGGTGTTTPALAAGVGISITGSWPGQTITNSSAYATLADPLPVGHGGTGLTAPAIVAGANITLSGSWPKQTVAVVASPSLTSVTLSSSTTSITFGLTTGGSHPCTMDGCGNVIYPSDTSSGWFWAVRDKSGNFPIKVFADGTQVVTLALPLAVTSGGTGAGSCSAGQILIASASNAAAFTTPDGCGVYNSAAESIPTGTLTPLTFDSEQYNNGSMHSTSTNPSRITAQKAGKYLVVGNVGWAFSGANRFLSLAIRRGGSAFLAEVDQWFTNTSGVNQNISIIVSLAVNDYVELCVDQNTGGALNCAGPSSLPWFAAQWLGP